MRYEAGIEGGVFVGCVVNGCMSLRYQIDLGFSRQRAAM